MPSESSYVQGRSDTIDKTSTIIQIMANHKSAKKRVRQDAKKRLHNRYYKKSTRTAITNLRNIESADEAKAFLPKVVSMIDRLAKKNQIHKNKAANLKAKLAKHIDRLAAAKA